MMAGCCRVSTMLQQTEDRPGGGRLSIDTDIYRAD